MQQIADITIYQHSYSVNIACEGVKQRWLLMTPSSFCFIGAEASTVTWKFGIKQNTAKTRRFICVTEYIVTLVD